SSRRRHTRFSRDWSSDVCSSDLVGRMLRLASLHLHTVQGPISAALGAIDEGDAAEFFHAASAFTVDAAARDRSHRWGASSEDPVAVGDAEAGPGSGSVGAAPAAD